MSIPIPKVEIGFDITGSNAPLFTLDSPTKGVLDNTQYPLGGQIFYDVTEYLISISIDRGKNREVDVYDPGLANVVLQNRERIFDPLFTSSPFYGQIIPKRAIRISYDNQLAFVGVIDDWNFSYQPNGESLVSAAASDAFVYFSNQTLDTQTFTSEKTGSRIAEVLSDPSVNWPLENRDIETGLTTIAGDTVEQDQNVLDYLQTVTRSEPGALFIGKNGSVVFRDRRTAAVSGGVTFADDGTGITYNQLGIEYGSETLYNEIVVGAVGGTAIAIDSTSQAEYGVLNLTQTGLLIEAQEDVDALASYLGSLYPNPEYRFRTLEVQLDELTTAQQLQILNLEIGSVVRIKFTPNGIPPAIDRYAEVIQVSHGSNQITHTVKLSFATLETALLVLDDTEFGKLDLYALAF
jgi:hypothetical protein